MMNDAIKLESKLNEQDKELVAVKRDVEHMSVAIEKLSTQINKNHEEVRKSIHDFRSIVAHAETVGELKQQVDEHDDEIKSIKQSKKFLADNWFNLIKAGSWCIAAIVAVLIWKSTQDKEAAQSIQADITHTQQITQLSRDVQTLIAMREK
jgi:predicted RNase H-like nuclease (RuvC/YqgF family)